MKKNRLLAAAILKDDLHGDDNIHAELFSAAFEDLDALRSEIAQIPKDIDASSVRFQKITTQAVDDFVTVANEALSKFIQRTNELKATLDAIEKSTGRITSASALLLPSQPVLSIAPPTPIPAPASINIKLWMMGAGTVFAGIIMGAVLAFLAIK